MLTKICYNKNIVLKQPLDSVQAEPEKRRKEKRKRGKENKNEKAQPDYKKEQYTTLPPSPFPLHPPLFPLRRQNRLFGEDLIW